MKGGSTQKFFQNSKIPTYQKMWASMMEMDSNTIDQQTGINRVLGN